MPSNQRCKFFYTVATDVDVRSVWFMNIQGSKQWPVNGQCLARMVTWPAKNFTRRSCWPVMSCWDSHVVHSWINNQIPNCKSERFNFIFIMTSHENIHQHISVRTAKDHSLAVCHAFKIDRNAIRATGVKSVQKNVYPFEQLLLSIQKKIFIC